MLEVLTSAANLLLIVSACVFVIMTATWLRFRQTSRNLEYAKGGGLASIITGVILGFTLAQAVSVVNIALLIGADQPFHAWLRLLQQVIITITALWAWNRLRKIGQ